MVGLQVSGLFGDPFGDEMLKINGNVLLMLIV